MKVLVGSWPTPAQIRALQWLSSGGYGAALHPRPWGVTHHALAKCAAYGWAIRNCGSETYQITQEGLGVLPIS